MAWTAKAGRRSLVVLGFLAGFAGIMLLLFAVLDAVDIDRDVIQSDFVTQGLAVRSRMAAERDVFDFQILMLGDSMLMRGKGMEHRDAIPAMLNQALQRQFHSRYRLKVYPYAFPGAGYTSFYHLADELLAGGPDLVLVEFNLSSLSPRWLRRWGRPDHSAWLGWSRIPEALGLQLHRLGLTVDRLLWTVACVELGCGNAWQDVQREQLRASGLLDLVRENLASRTEMRAIDDLRDQRREAREAARRDDPILNRRTAEEYGEIYEVPLEGTNRDDLALEMMAATVHRFRSAGTAVVVYVTPINVEGMKRRGVWRQSGIDQTLADIEASVVEADGAFVDLHDLLPEAMFRDYAEHLTYEGYLNGQALVVARLARVAAENLRRRNETAD